MTLLVVSVLIFLATNVLPGNVATVVLGRNATTVNVQRVESRLNLKHSVVSRYFTWLGDAVQGDHDCVLEVKKVISAQAMISSQLRASRAMGTAPTSTVRMPTDAAPTRFPA